MTEERCWCRRCAGEGYPYVIVCPVCGDKRCVRAADHQAPCAQDDIYAHNAWVQKRLDTASAETREECAQVCEERANGLWRKHGRHDLDTGTSYMVGEDAGKHEIQADEANDCAAAIRAKG